MEDLVSLSEITAGLVLGGKVSANAVNPDDLAAPYDKIVQMAKDKKSLNDIFMACGTFAVDSCIQAAERVASIQADWPVLLEHSALRADVGRKLLPLAKKLERGEDADLSKVLSLLGSFEDRYRDFTALSEVAPLKDPWVPSYYPPIDKYVGGLPKSSLTLLAGPPGTGKTSLMSRLLINCARAGKKTVWFSLEMTLALVTMRMLEIEPKLKKSERALILGTEDEYEVDEVYAAAARAIAAHPDIYLICIDFADMMIEGEEKTAKASHIYRSMARLAKRLGRPIVLACQLSEGYVGGVPRVNHIRWSRLAEAMAALILLLYNPDQLWVDQGQTNKKNPLPYIEQKAYIIVGKSRYGYINPSSTTGAMLVDWKRERGWGDQVHDWKALGGL